MTVLLMEVNAYIVVGAILSQCFGERPKLHLMTFYSKNSMERNYDMGNREVLAIMLAIEE